MIMLFRAVSFYSLYGLPCNDTRGFCNLWITLQWRHNGIAGVSNHQAHYCLLNRLSTRRSKKASKLRVTALCVGNSLVTGELPVQRTSNAENVSIWWRHHDLSHDELSISCENHMLRYNNQILLFALCCKIVHCDYISLIGRKTFLTHWSLGRWHSFKNAISECMFRM